MDIGNLFWLFFIVLALQPLVATRAARIAAIQPEIFPRFVPGAR